MSALVAALRFAALLFFLEDLEEDAVDAPEGGMMGAGPYQLSKREVSRVTKGEGSSKRTEERSCASVAECEVLLAEDQSWMGAGTVEREQSQLGGVAEQRELTDLVIGERRRPAVGEARLVPVS